MLIIKGNSSALLRLRTPWDCNFSRGQSEWCGLYGKYGFLGLYIPVGLKIRYCTFTGYGYQIPQRRQEANFKNCVYLAKEYPLATVISTINQQIHISHLPLVYRENDSLGIVGHLDNSISTWGTGKRIKWSWFSWSRDLYFTNYLPNQPITHGIVSRPI